MTAPDHATKPFETILRERGHPYMTSQRLSPDELTNHSRVMSVGRGCHMAAAVITFIEHGGFPNW
jgi:hypothetical protein